MDTTPAPAKPAVVVRRAAKPAAPYVPAIGPKLRVLLLIVFGLFAVLGATGVYLAAVTALNWVQSPQSYTTPFSLWVFLAHIAIGVIGTIPYFAFGIYHWLTARKRPNRVAVRLGILLFVAGAVVCLSGFALIQLEGLPQVPTGTLSRSVVYWLHIAVPVAAVWLYVQHRRAGPPIKWRLARVWGFGVVAFTAGMMVMHSQDPQQWFREGPKEGVQYFEPAATRTDTGQFIDADVLMMDGYCAKCHEDIANDHFHSAHKFSSFNNPAYLASVKETREVSLKRDGNVKASRWCAGCHDVVPFVSGQFDDPNYDIINHPTAHAGLTCTVCHAVTALHGTVGNGGYTIGSPAHYPFARSENRFLQYVNNQLVKAKPDFHKQTFLKPFHKTPEFCAACHKVSLPEDLNQYKPFLRGQNHYDTFLLSGVSGHGVRSFYYPPQAKPTCASCHMPDKPVGDLGLNFGGRTDPATGRRTQRDHRFPGANTGLFELLKHEPRYAKYTEGFQKTIDMHADYLRGVAPDGSDKKVRIDLFGLKPDNLEGPLSVLRPELPRLEPGKSYVVEVVVRTLGLGHPLSQGTVDSNEIWIDFAAKINGTEIARNGALSGPDDSGEVDRWAHYINVHMLDRHGNRINRRNPQDIFTPLYDKQIGPGAAAVAHYRVDVPADAAGPVELSARVRYRKFDHEYMQYVHGDRPVPKLPIVDLCEDKVTLPVAGKGDVPAQTSPVKPPWQRLNDYGIANLLEGGAGKRGNFKQAEDAFKRLLAGGDKAAAGAAHLNLARVYIEEGRLDEAAAALRASGETDPPAPAWSRVWFTSLVNTANATRREHLDAVIADLERLLDPAAQPSDRGFDFTKDYVVWNALANRLHKRRLYEPADSEARRAYLMRAVKAGETVLSLDSEDIEGHDLLMRAYAELAGGHPTDAPAAVAFTADQAAARAAVAADRKAPADQRRAACVDLIAGVPALPDHKLSAVKEGLEKLRPAYHAEADADMKAALAAALTVLHRESHGMYKPDEVAMARTTTLYREKNPAANYAARARVVYPTTKAHQQAILATGDLPPAR